MFLVPLPQGPRCFSDILLPTVQSCTLVTINDTTFLLLGVLVFGLDQYLFEGPITLEMCLNSIFAAGVLDAFPQALNIWDDYVSHTGSSPKGSSCLVVTVGSIGVLQCVSNMVVTIIPPVAIYYFVLYFT